MNEPKISVLIPMYNRKHLIQDCVNSVLNQTFQDFEIVIRDDGSTDGSAEFVAQTYAAQIASGKIKLVRNEENRGEYRTVCRLLKFDANGKYMHLLHSDDIFMPYALQHLNEVAEITNADVIHTVGHLNSAEDGTLDPKDFKPQIHDSRPVQNVELIPTDPRIRFADWAVNGTCCDAQYNLFSKKFIREKDLLFDPVGYGLNVFLLFWMMTAKIFIKTPVLYYVRREAPDSITNHPRKNLPAVANGYVHGMMWFSRSLDILLPRIKFFKDNPSLQHFAKYKFMTDFNGYAVTRLNIYKNGVSPELWDAVQQAFTKYLGDENAYYPTLLFSMIHAAEFGHNLTQIMLQQAFKSLEAIAPPPPESH